jgi:hypothetical protein
MEAQGVKRLPQTFRELLEHAGYGVQVLFMGDASGYRDLLELKDELKTSMSEDLKYKDQFPEDAFVFVTHLASWFAFFLTDNDNDDPPVYQYNENTRLEITEASVSEYFERLLEDNIKWRDSIALKQHKR